LIEAGRVDHVEDPLIEVGEVAQQALKEMRLLVYELRPPALEEEGLLGGLHRRLGAVEKRSGVEASLIADAVVDLPAAVEEGLYRIAQEALNNALKHAGATSVIVYFRIFDEQVELEVTDDGQGFNPDAIVAGGGMGLTSMRERAARMGGELQVLSAPGDGTTVRARVGMGKARP
jgi:signal transduction histidine kinase